MKELSQLFVLLAAVLVVAARKKTCEVCIGVLQKSVVDMDKADLSNQAKLDDKIKEFCGGSKGKDNRFCYYIGALPESATYIMNEVTKPLSWGMPAEKVCERLNEKDAQICDLEYDKTIDWKTVDLNKLKVKDLKKILDEWGEQCRACTEKTEYIKRVQELMPKYVPKSEL